MLYKMTCNGFLKSFGYLELFSDFFFNNFLCSTDSEEGICLSLSLSVCSSACPSVCPFVCVCQQNISESYAQI